MAESAGANALEVALQHLHPPKQEQQQRLPRAWGSQSSTAATVCRAPLNRTTPSILHRVSRRLCSAARATRTYADLGASQSSAGPSQLPWSFLDAAPGLTTIDIQLQQVPGLVAGPQDMVTSLTGRLRALGVEGLQHNSHTSSSSSSSSFQALGCLLAACTGLQALRVSGDLQPAGSLLLEAALLSGNTSIGVRSSSSGGCTSSSRTVQANASSMTPRRSHCITRAAAAAAATANLLASATQGGGGSSSGGAAADNSRIGVKSSSSGAAPAPLLQLQLHGVPLAPFGAWLQQRGQLGQLQRLYLEGWPCRSCQGRHQAEQVVSHFDQSWGWLTSLAGLQEMRLEAACGPNLQGRPPVLGAAHLQPRLTALQGLTQLSIKGFELSVDLHQSLSALTQLQQLQLTTQDHHQQQQQQQQLSWGWLTALRQLTHLDLSSTRLEDQLPADLGQALPHLEVLLVADCDLRRLPKGLTRLSRLDASRNQVLGDQLEALWDATRLLQLTLSGCNVSTTMHLTALTALEVLQLRGARRRCYCTSTYFCDRCRECYDDSAKTPPPSDQLQPVPMNLPLLVNLRHLDLRSGEWWVENLVAAGPLQHLTFLDLGNGITVREDGERRRDTGRLPDLGVLPSLQQLNLGGLVIEQSDWDRVGAWLGLQTQLTRLGMECTHLPWGKPSRGTKQQVQALAHLPTQLVELDLHGCDLQQLPPRLGQLTQLKVLLVGGNEGLPAEMLPWLPALQQLEVLEVEAVEDVGAAVGLLQQLPALRQFSVSQGAGGPSGEELDPAQELYGQLPHLQRVGHDILGFGPVWT